MLVMLGTITIKLFHVMVYTNVTVIYCLFVVEVDKVNS